MSIDRPRDLDEVRAVITRRRDEFSRVGAVVSGAAICDEFLDALDCLAPRDAAQVQSVQSVVRSSPESLGVDPRSRFWNGSADSRLTVPELAAEVGKPKSWVYRHTQASAPIPIPHKKVGGELYFVRGEVRAWWKSVEIPVVTPTGDARGSDARRQFASSSRHPGAPEG